MFKKIFITILFLSFSVLNAQFNEFQPGYKWLTIEGKHVKVHYHEEAERTARVVAKIADEVWGPITSLYQYEPESVHFVIKDIDDYSNGATYFFDNKIEIWASALDFDLRGVHNWLRNVISHEFTHLVQIQSSMKLTRTIPAIYLQFLNYEDKRRPDILYGFPNFIGSYPVASVNVPAWFAEGTAQYMRKEFNYDNWDTHRDMILRCFALDNKMLSWNEMGVFSKTSLGSEAVYNAGFALTRYISQKYGEDKLREISHKLGKLTNFTIDAAFEDVLGKDGNQIYDEWSSFVKKSYEKRIKKVKENLAEGDVIGSEGFGNFYPAFSRDGTKLIYISNKSADYFSLSSIYEYDLKTGTEKSLVDGVNSTLSFTPDDKKIVYAKLSDDNPNNTKIHDIYTYDILKDDSKRITFGLRANNPSISNDGKKIVFLYQKDGTTNVGMIDADGKNFKRLTFFENGEQVYNPKFSPDDSFVIFDYSYANNRNIARVDTNGSNYTFILDTNADERNGTFGPGGKLFYSSDESGIFNLYNYDFETGKKTQITNVIGGVFMSAVNRDGNIAYSGYTSGGFKLFTFNNANEKEIADTNKYVWVNNPPLGEDKPNGDINQFSIDSLRNYNDYVTPDYKSEPYSGFFSKFSFLPFIRYDNYNTSNSGLDKIKPGLYVASNDYLNRYSVFAGASINRRLERDLFLTFEYRDKVPLLYNLGLRPELSLELYSISRETSVDIPFGIDSTFTPPRIDYNVPTDVTYNLFEADFVAKHRIFNEFNNLEIRFVFSQYTATLGSFIIPESNNTLYPTSDDKYFIGRDLKIKFTHDEIYPTIDSDINPTGRKIEFTYDYEFNEYNDEGKYEVADGILKPVYNHYDFHKVELNWKEYFPLAKGQALTAQFRAGSILGPPVPDFFDFYLGGLVGMKSYPFYAVSGNEVGWLNLTYRFPLFTHIDTRVGHLYFDKIFLAVYADIGDAWTGEFPELNKFKKGAGAEIRIKMNSFYIFPTSLFFSAAYSFDQFTRNVLGENVTYGKEWRFYGGLLFDFSL